MPFDNHVVKTIYQKYENSSENCVYHARVYKKNTMLDTRNTHASDEGLVT